MLKIGLDHRWVDLAMGTVTTASYSVLINGEPRGFVHPSKGIKQVDPFSPYLFILYAKGLLVLLRKAEEDRVLHGILSSQNGVCISHLLFADDSLLFCHTTVEYQRLLTLLERYEVALGQVLNKHKTSLFLVRTQVLK